MTERHAIKIAKRVEADAKPLEDKATGRKYLFTPKWAGGEKRYIDQREAA